MKASLFRLIKHIKIKTRLKLLFVNNNPKSTYSLPATKIFFRHDNHL